jgi:hypothetical protein
LAGCTPAEPSSASPADSIFIESAATVNRNHQVGGGIFNQQNEEFSVGIDSAAIAANAAEGAMARFTFRC